tara:strand:- start:21445 stop:25491 length:4047 start_codon:yes stop_codon:yes gene_type:complete
MAENSKFASAILDREIQSASQDEFGHRHFAAMLRGLVESKQNEPPFSIGLLGVWGSGKSSIKSMYLNELADDTCTDGCQVRSRRIVPITFNAWRFGGEDIKRALLRHVYVQLGGDKEKLDDALFRSVQKSSQEAKSTLDFWKEVLELWGWSLLQAAIVVVIFVASVVGIARLCSVTDETAISWLIVASAAASVAVIKFLLSADRFPRRTSVTRIDNPISASEIYEDMLIQQLDEFKNGKTKLKHGKHCERLVIFVDDLDRLSPEEMIVGLDAVRTFMELPSQAHSLGIVFVISCDEDRVAEALADRRQRGVKSDMPGAVFTQTDAHRFLDRIFQFRMEIPPFPKRDMRSFAEKWLRNSLTGLDEDLESAETSIETLIDKMIHVGVATPRNALQIVNCFIQCWWVAKKRELDGAGSNRPGGLSSGAVTGYPLAVGAICALRVDFPDFYRDLQKQPDLIHHFSDVFIRKSELEEKSDEIRARLSKYSTTEGNLKEVYRSLRQFIAGVQGVPWPKTLRPILFFSQDPVTRKYGDKALALNVSFVSGDVDGVLEALGRENDTKPLSDDDIRLLNGLTEELTSETQTRKNNAAFVLSSLTERFPADSAHLLISPLARQLGDSPELRWRLGMDNIGKVIGAATPTDKRMVAARLIDDLLKTDEKIEFKLPSLQAPSLDEAMAMCEEACSLALDVHRDHGLEVKAEALLLNWLESRRVQLEGGEQFLPFDKFESWIEKHEDRLLPLFGARYPNQICSILKSDSSTILEEEGVIRRSQIVFDRLLVSGEESRPDLWRFVADYILFGTAGLLSFGSKYALKVISGDKRPSSAEFNSICTALSNRLMTDLATVDVNETAQTMIQLVVARKQELTEDTAQSITELVSQWVSGSETVMYAVTLATPVGESSPQLLEDLINNWSNRIISDLPIACVEWMAESYATILDDGQRNRLMKHLNPIHTNDNISVEQSCRIIAFVSKLSPQAFGDSKMQAFLNSVFSQLGQRHANPNEYLQQVFSVVPQAINYVPPSTVASMIMGLFPNTQDRPSLLGWLHGKMERVWPHASDDLSGYNPDQLFDQAAKVIQSNPSQEHMDDLLKSMSDMVARNVVSNEKRPVVLESACQVWQYYRDAATAAIKLHDEMPTAPRIAQMINGLPEDNSDFEALRVTWGFIAERASLDELMSITSQIIQQPPKGENDRCLRLWLSLRSGDAPKVLSFLLSSDDLNDSQKKRAWLQIEQNVDLSSEFFLDVVSGVASMQGFPETVSEMLDFKSKITEKFSSEQQRYDLGNVLLTGFRSATSAETKRRLAEWLNDLSVESVVRKLSEGERLANEELDILRPVFEKNRYWKQIEKNVAKEE